MEIYFLLDIKLFKNTWAMGVISVFTKGGGTKMTFWKVFIGKITSLAWKYQRLYVNWKS